MDPTPLDLHTSVPLSNLSIAYAQDASEFIADRVFPVVKSDKQANFYYEYDRDPWFRSDAGKRAPGTSARRTGYTVKKTPYGIDVYAIADEIDDQSRANADSAFSLDADSTELTTQQNLILREQLWISGYFGPSIWTGGNLTGVASSGSVNATHFLQWDQAGSSPIQDVKAQIRAIARLTGRRPNKLVLGPEVADALTENTEIVERVKYTQLGFLDYELLAAAFGVNEVLVPFAIQNSAAEGAALDMEFMYGKSALLIYAAPAPGLKKPSGGYTFEWDAYLGGSSAMRMKKFRNEDKECDVVESQMAFAFQKVSSDMGVFLQSAIA